MRDSMSTLFVFAHQDDEIAAAARITSCVRNGISVRVVFLTDGQGRNATSRVRDEESRRVLSKLGVDLANVHFVGSEHQIPDGALHEHLDKALQLLEAAVEQPVDAVWCLSWEGGHQDHDASHLIALAFARRRGIEGQVHEVPLYHGYRLRGPFFRTMKPLAVGAPWIAHPISFRDGLRIVALCYDYRSQRKTWLALLPTAMVRLLLGQREWSRPASLARIHEKPHEGPLFYERRFGVAWSEFQRHSREFIARFLTAGPSTN
jgi:LmbE family N-acetylglucosaminyl deacetylase